MKCHYYNHICINFIIVVDFIYICVIWNATIMIKTTLILLLYIQNCNFVINNKKVFQIELTQSLLSTLIKWILKWWNAYYNQKLSHM